MEKEYIQFSDDLDLEEDEEDFEDLEDEEGYTRLTFEEFIDLFKSFSEEKPSNSKISLMINTMAYNLQEKGHPEFAFPLLLEIADWNRKCLKDETEYREKLALENTLAITCLQAAILAGTLEKDIHVYEDLLEEAYKILTRLKKKMRCFQRIYIEVLFA